MKLKHMPQHHLKARITKLVILLSVIVYAYIGITQDRAIDWFADRFVLLALAYGFRRALGGRNG